MDSDAEMPSAGPSGGKVCEKKRFEVKKWNAVALWAWDIVVDNCAICRNHIMDLCIECQANQVRSKQSLNLKVFKWRIFPEYSFSVPRF